MASTVAVAYAEAAQSAPLLFRPRAHETRVIAASVALQNATPVVDILQAVAQVDHWLRRQWSTPTLRTPAKE